MCQTTTYARYTSDIGVGTIDGDYYAIRCTRYDSGVTLFHFRKWNGSESTVRLGTNNRYGCTCKQFTLRRKQCRHIQHVVRHGMEIDDPRDVGEDVGERADELDHYFAMQVGG